MRLGILGGTFNPPHIGHLICGQEALRELGLERVMLVPARIPPHKPVEHEPGAEHRLALCRLAVAGDERFAVSDVELRREGPSYTVDTLRQLRVHAPHDELVLILGGDIAAGLPSWRMPERVLELATVAVAKRRGTARGEVERALASLPRCRESASPRRCCAAASAPVSRSAISSPSRCASTSRPTGSTVTCNHHHIQGEHDQRITQ
jgi:nicotinate-nucleotide adenylyltransferase